jgi:hypothetical protein
MANRWKDLKVELDRIVVQDDLGKKLVRPISNNKPGMVICACDSIYLRGTVAGLWSQANSS